MRFDISLSLQNFKKPLADINIDDVDSTEVVKGAAASSLYGSQAANGVIVVTSKKHSTLMGRHLSPRYGQVILVSGYPVLTAVN